MYEEITEERELPTSRFSIQPAPDHERIRRESDLSNWEACKEALTGKNVVIQSTLIVLMTTEVMFRKMNTARYMRNYVTVMSNLIVFFATVAFFGIIAVKMGLRNPTQPTPVLVNRHLFAWFALIGVVDMAAGYMIILSSANITPTLATLLSQGVIPITMLASKVLLGKRFHKVHYAGAVIIFGGIGASVGGAWQYNGSNGNDFGWACIFFLANIPITAASIFKEKVMTNPQQPADMDALNAFVALVQFFLGMAVSPLAFHVQYWGVENNNHDVPAPPMSGVWQSFDDGIQCWIAGHNTITNPHSPFPVDDCSGAPWAVWIHMVIVVLLNIFVLLVIFHGSAVMFFIAGAVSIPLTAVLSAPDFLPSELHAQFQWEDVLGILLTLVGLMVYRLQPEEQVDEQEDHGQPLLT